MVYPSSQSAAHFLVCKGARIGRYTKYLVPSKKVHTNTTESVSIFGKSSNFVLATDRRSLTVRYGLYGKRRTLLLCCTNQPDTINYTVSLLDEG